MECCSTWGAFFFVLVSVLFGFLMYFYVEEGDLGWLIACLILETILLLPFWFFEEKILNHKFYPNKSQYSKYYLFKSNLIRANITRQNVRNCFRLVDLEIDFIAASKTGFRQVGLYVVMYGLGVISSLLSGLDINNPITWAGLFFLVMFGLFIYFLANLFPSSIEKRKELKYFMHLYCYEVSGGNDV